MMNLFLVFAKFWPQLPNFSDIVERRQFYQKFAMYKVDSDLKNE